MDTAPVVLVGHRKGAIAALRRMGRPAIVLVPASTPRDVRSDVVLASRTIDVRGGPAELIAAARGAIDEAGAEPAAVVALAERTVVAAARLRAELGLPGNDRETALACADKRRMKEVASAAGIPTARWVEVRAGTRPDGLVDTLGLPIVLKPRRDSGGRGQSVVRRAEDLAPALAGLDASGPGHLAESFVEGVESSVECFVEGGRVAFANTTEYLVPRHANILPSDPGPAARAEVVDLTERVIEALGVERGITNTEVFRTAAGPVLGEIAIRPPGGRLMALIKRAWGFDPWEALLRIELGERFEFPAEPKRVAGVHILHPGVGRITAIEGVEAARAVPNVRRVKLKVAVGDVVTERVGSGQDIGSIQAEAGTRDGVAEALTRASAALRVELGP